MYKDFIKNLKDNVKGKVSVRGTLSTPTEKETYPIGISNEMLGGPFAVTSVDELKGIPLERLILGCKCTITQNKKAVTYVLISMPTATLETIPNVDISDYWYLDENDIGNGAKEAIVEYQYSPDVDLQIPPFRLSDISEDAYNAGYKSDSDFQAGDTSKIIWGAYDVQTSKWVRARVVGATDWGIPTTITRGYDSVFRTTMFQWVAKGTTPETPRATKDGQPNTNPVGWSNLSDIPNGVDPSTFKSTHNLWAISATFSGFRVLDGNWTAPINISDPKDLIRYGNDATNQDYMNSAYWSEDYTPGNRYRARNVEGTSDWIVDKVDRSSVEISNTVYKEFPDSYTALDSDAPQTQLGYGVDGWMPEPFVTSTGKSLFISISKADVSNGGLTRKWSKPVRIGCNNTYELKLLPKEGGLVFSDVIDKSIMTQNQDRVILQADFKKNSVSIDPSEIDSVKWYTGNFDTKQLIPNLNVGTKPNRNIQINGSELIVYPENVSNSLIVWVEVVVGGISYFSGLTLQHVGNTESVFVDLEQPDGNIIKDNTPKNFIPIVRIGGVKVTDLSQYITRFDFAGSTLTPINNVTQEVSINTSAVTDQDLLEFNITIGGIIYTKSVDLVRVFDGESLVRWFSSHTSIDMDLTPTLGDANGWSLDSTDAIWVVEKIGDDGVFNKPYKVKGDKGEGSGIFQKTVYRSLAPLGDNSWITTKPTNQTHPDSPLAPIDWTDYPDKNVGTGYTIYGSIATFKKTETTDYTEKVSNWAITPYGWSVPFKVTHFPAAGSSGTPGTDGNNGWSPVLSIEEVGNEAKLKLVDWTGGTGSKPVGIGYYVGLTGLVSTFNLGVNIKGPKGDTASVKVPTTAILPVFKGIAGMSAGWSEDQSRLDINLEVETDDTVKIRVDINNKASNAALDVLKIGKNYSVFCDRVLPYSLIDVQSTILSTFQKPRLVTGALVKGDDYYSCSLIVKYVSLSSSLLNLFIKVIDLPSGVDTSNCTIEFNKFLRIIDKPKTETLKLNLQ